MRSFRYFRDYLLHYFSSHSRHGTHSPFVYALAEQVIYAPNDGLGAAEGTAAQQLQHAIASFIKEVYLQDHGTAAAKPLVYHCTAEQLDIEALKILQRQYTYLVVNDIYRSRSGKQLWKDLCSKPEFIVTIDLFYFGLIVHRKEQPKQHFKLRFPEWKYRAKKLR